MIGVGDLLAPIISAMRREMLQESYFQADETAVPVQRPGENKGENHQAYLSYKRQLTRLAGAVGVGND